MNSRGDIIGKFIERRNKTVEPCEAGANGYGEQDILNKKIDNTGFSGHTFFPCDTRVKNVGENSGNASGKERYQPKIIIGIADASNNGIENKIK